jgi:hypothetical protein
MILPLTSTMDDIIHESFPDAEYAFRYAFSISNPTPKLLQLIRAHPNVRTITILVIIYIELVEMDPTQLDKLTGALVDLKNSNETVAGYDRVGNPIQIQIADSLRVELHDLLRSELAGPEDGAVTPCNEYLIASLLSAMATKFGLSDSPAFPYAVVCGLDYQSESDVETREVLVLGTCLQLSISGSYLCGPNGIDSDFVLSGLRAIRNAHIMNHPRGRRLLEVSL